MDVNDKAFIDINGTNLKKDTMELEKASSLVQQDIEKTQKSIDDNEAKIRRLRQEIEELQVKVALYASRSRSLTEGNRVLDELSKRVAARSQKWKNALSGTQEKTYYSKSNIKNPVGDSNGDSDLEPACNRKVRLACKQIMSLKKSQLGRDALERSSFDADSDVSRDQLWTMLEELLSDYRAKEILDSLCQNTTQSSNSLVCKTKLIDLAKDAGELRFKFESGKLKDVSEQPALFRSVDQLIEQGQSAHFQRFLEAEKAKNDAWKGRRRFEKAQQVINNLLQKKYSSSPKELILKRRALNLETELYGIKAAIAYAKELMADLDNQRTTKKMEDESLTAKFNKIQDFEARAQRNQLMIQALVKQNGTARNRIEQQQNEVLSYLKNYVCTVGNEIDAIVDSFKRNLTDELDCFSSLRISCLNSIELQSGSHVPSDTMSIHRLTSLQDDKAGNALKDILQGLDFPSHYAPEEIFSKVKEHREIATEAISKSNLALESSKELEPEELLENISKIQENCEEMSELAERKKKETVPVIKKAFTSATDSLQECLELEELISSWWEQPAQFLVPWVKEDGFSLQEWRVQWDEQAARLKQMKI